MHFEVLIRIYVDLFCEIPRKKVIVKIIEKKKIFLSQKKNMATPKTFIDVVTINRLSIAKNSNLK